jgi:hypothetical protein
VRSLDVGASLPANNANALKWSSASPRLVGGDHDCDAFDQSGSVTVHVRTSALFGFANYAIFKKIYKPLSVQLPTFFPPLKNCAWMSNPRSWRREDLVDSLDPKIIG